MATKKGSLKSFMLHPLGEASPNKFKDVHYGTITVPFVFAWNSRNHVDDMKADTVLKEVQKLARSGDAGAKDAKMLLTASKETGDYEAAPYRRLLYELELRQWQDKECVRQSTMAKEMGDEYDTNAWTLHRYRTASVKAVAQAHKLGPFQWITETEYLMPSYDDDEVELGEEQAYNAYSKTTRPAKLVNGSTSDNHLDPALRKEPGPNMQSNTEFEGGLIEGASSRVNPEAIGRVTNAQKRHQKQHVPESIAKRRKVEISNDVSTVNIIGQGSKHGSPQVPRDNVEIMDPPPLSTRNPLKPNSKQTQETKPKGKPPPDTLLLTVSKLKRSTDLPASVIVKLNRLQELARSNTTGRYVKGVGQVVTRNTLFKEPQFKLNVGHMLKSCDLFQYRLDPSPLGWSQAMMDYYLGRKIHEADEQTTSRGKDRIRAQSAVIQPHNHKGKFTTHKDADVHDPLAGQLYTPYYLANHLNTIASVASKVRDANNATSSKKIRITKGKERYFDVVKGITSDAKRSSETLQDENRAGVRVLKHLKDIRARLEHNDSAYKDEIRLLRRQMIAVGLTPVVEPANILPIFKGQLQSSDIGVGRGKTAAAIGRDLLKDFIKDIGKKADASSGSDSSDNEAKGSGYDSGEEHSIIQDE